MEVKEGDRIERGAKLAEIQADTTSQIRALQDDEVNAVSGGFLPLLVMAFAVGFDASFIGVTAFGELD
jgi:hypothetical protein